MRRGTAKARRQRLTTHTFACALVVAVVCGVSGSVSAQARRQEGRVEGVVRDETGSPVANARVTLRAAVSFNEHRVTDADGHFVFDGVMIDEGTLHVEASGFSTLIKNWRADEGQTAQLGIVLSPARLAEEVTVTASRAETRLSETAASVRVLSSEEISATAAVAVDDALRQVPGFQLFRRAGSRTANPTAQGVSLRGTGGSGASRAVVLLDGLPLTDPFGGWVYWGRIPRASVSRIEVLRGGASDLYGSGALGGVINIITREADSSPFVAFETSYGNQQTPTGSLVAGANKGAWSARLAAELFSTDGYILVDERERGPVDTPAGSRHATLDLTLERRLSDKARAFVRGSYFGESRANGTPLQTNDTRIRQLGFGADWQSARAGAFSLRANIGAQVYDQTFSSIAADRNSESLVRVQRVPAQSLGFNAQWSRAVGARQTLVAGLGGREVRGASDEGVFVGSRLSSLVGAGGRERSVGVFVKDIVRVGERLFVAPAMRFDRWRNFAGLSVTRPLSTPGAAATVNAFPARVETAFSPQLSVLYSFGGRASLSASAYRAFRQPTLNELYRSFRVGDVLTLANEQLSAERLTGGEAGGSFALLRRKLAVRGTLFLSEIARPVANVTLSVSPGLIRRQRQNLGRTRSRGVELEWDAPLTSRWNLSGGYLFADAAVLRFPADAALEGRRIPQVPRHQFTFQARYSIPSRWTLSAQARAAGEQFDDDQNRFRLGRFFVLDAFASRHIGRGAEAFVAAENLFNERYEVGRTPVTTLSSPRLMRFGVRFQHGSR